MYVSAGSFACIYATYYVIGNADNLVRMSRLFLNNTIDEATELLYSSFNAWCLISLDVVED